MKARHEFTSDEEYRKYLRVYFAGLALSIHATNFSYYSGNVERIATAAIKLSDEMIKQLDL